MTTSTKQFLIYARKSTESEERQIRSINDQLAELREIARRDNLNVVAELVESQTAKMPGRPVFNDMLKRLEKGEASGILAWHPDRLARNSVDGGRIIHMVDTGAILDMRFSTFWFEPTPQGKFMLSIAFGQSKYYVDNLSENIKRGQRQKVRNGLYPGRAPLGYLNERKNRGIASDPERAKLVSKAFELYATGDYTLDRLTATVNGLGLTSTQGGTPLSRTQYHRLLQNPVYYGLIRYGEEIHDGKHEPLITKKLFDDVRVVMLQRGKPKEPLLKPFLFRKAFKCGECGGFITTESQKGHHYLRCTKKKGPCSQPYMREEQVVTLLDATFQKIALPQEWIDELTRDLAMDREQSVTAQRGRVATLQNLTAQAEAKLARLMAAYLEEAIPLTEYRELKAGLLEEKAALVDRKKRVEEEGRKRLEPVTSFVKSLQEATLLASTDKSAEKVEFLKKTGSNLKIRNRQIELNFRDPWKTVELHALTARSETHAPDSGARRMGESEPVYTLAEREGFEPSIRFKPYTAFPVLLLRPLGHLSRASALPGRKV